MRKSVGLIPKYIAAGSSKGLRRLMLQVQLKLGYGVDFHDKRSFVTEYDKSGKAKKFRYEAWYYDNEVIGSHNVQEKLNGDND
jgi:hypothetical protein